HELEENSPSSANFEFNNLIPGFTNSRIPNFGSVGCGLSSLVDLEFSGSALGSDSAANARFQPGAMSSGYNDVSSGAIRFRFQDISPGAISSGFQDISPSAISSGFQDVSPGVKSSGFKD
ncbi:23962_t:CDS:2, partial [Gigaspora rosea]